MEILLSSGRLREWKKEDAPSLVQHANNEQIALNMRDGFPFPYTLEDAHEWLNKSRYDLTLNMAIEINHEAVGGLGLLRFSNVYRNNSELGYWLGEQHWNKGIMTEAVIKFVRYVFETTDITRISACVFEPNKPSLHVLEKAGFLLEGIHKKAVIKNNEVMDEFFYAILKRR